MFLSTVKDRPEISSPVDFEHTVHVGFNQNTGEFTVSGGSLYVCKQPCVGMGLSLLLLLLSLFKMTW